MQQGARDASECVGCGATRYEFVPAALDRREVPHVPGFRLLDCDDDKSCYYLSSGPEVVRVR